uniref:Uncharacterized protein n=1 Tax=Arundo donax TaxID=35708 RepID=A0A0A9EC05_ARUDO
MQNYTSTECVFTREKLQFLIEIRINRHPAISIHMKGSSTVQGTSTFMNNRHTPELNRVRKTAHLFQPNNDSSMPQIEILDLTQNNLYN